MDDDTFYKEAHNDNTTREDPLRGPDLERPDFGLAIFEVEAGCLTDLPVMLTESDQVRHFSAFMDSDPFDEDTYYLMTIKDNDGNIHGGFMQADAIETHDWSSIAAVVDEIQNHGDSADFTFDFTVKCDIEADEKYDEMCEFIQDNGIGLLRAFIEDLYEEQIDDSRF